MGGSGTERRGTKAGREDGGVEEEEEVGEEIEANMADWMCHSQSVGRLAAEGRHAGL